MGRSALGGSTSRWPRAERIVAALESRLRRGRVDAAAERAIRVEDGLAAVREWEQEHGEPGTEELAWAGKVTASDLRA